LSSLIDWNFMSEFGEGAGAQGGVWECPDLFELPVNGDPDDTKWILQVDIGDGVIAGGSGA
jgi:fructan beta-fructosidase